MQGCHHQARRAKANSPAIHRWVRVPPCIKSHQGRQNPRQHGWSQSRSDQSSVAVPAASAGTVSVPVPPRAPISSSSPSGHHASRITCHSHSPKNSENPRNITFYALKLPCACSQKRPPINPLSTISRGERALACFRTRLAVGTDARQRASTSGATDIVVILKNPVISLFTP